MAKSGKFAEVLEKRISRGDYSLRDLPTEQEFADEVGASRMTARRALLKLINKGLIVRKPHGRLVLSNVDARSVQTPRLVLLTPAYTSRQYLKWNAAAERAAYACGASLQPASFAHWDDPVITRALKRFDGVFVVPSSEPLPRNVAEHFAESGRLVMLDADYTHLGVPSIRMMRGEFVHHLGDHLLKLGHRRVDCLNTQPGQGIIQLLLEHWTQWKAIHGVEGNIIHEPVAPGSEPTVGAWRVMNRVLDAGDYRATALLCLTNGVMTGAIRAFHDHGRRVGQDISVCSVEAGGQLARLETPSRTALITPDPDPYIEFCIKWLASGKHWQGPLMLQPTTVELFEGESTTAVEFDPDISAQE